MNNTAQELGKVRSFVGELESELERLRIYPRDVVKFPADTVLLMLLSKAFGVVKACVALIEAGYPEEAYGLSRSLVECATILRYLTHDPNEQDSRVRKYIEFEKAEKRFWLEHAGAIFTNDPGSLADFEAFAKELDIENIDPREATSRHWSSVRGFIWAAVKETHPLDGATATEDFRKIMNAVDYHATSQYVHCSITGVGNYFSEPFQPYVVQSSHHRESVTQKTFYLLAINLFGSLAYVLFGLQIERSVNVNDSFQNLIIELRAVQKAGRLVDTKNSDCRP